MTDTELDQLPPPPEQPAAELPAADLANAAMTAALAAHHGGTIDPGLGAYAQIHAQEARRILNRAATRPANEGLTEELTTAWLAAGRAEQATTLYRQLTTTYPPPADLTPAQAHPYFFLNALQALNEAQTATAAYAKKAGAER